MLMMMIMVVFAPAAALKVRRRKKKIRKFSFKFGDQIVMMWSPVFLAPTDEETLRISLLHTVTVREKHGEKAQILTSPSALKRVINISCVNK